jgi:hypothetical protein
MKFNRKMMMAMLGCLPAATSLSAQADAGVFYERKSLSFTPMSPSQSGNAATTISPQSFGVHVIGFFDTTGAIRAGLGNAVSKESAKMSKEQELEDKGAAAGTPYTYSWQERQPVANDGEIYRIMWSSEGSPLGIITDMFQVHPVTDYTPSFLGLEIDHTLWSYKGSPVSYGVGFGTYMHIYNNVVGWSLSRGSISIPITFTVSAQPLNDVTVYGNFAIGPYGYIKNYVTYNHYEAGAIWTLTKNLRVNASYRTVNDYLTQDAKVTDYGKYQATMLSLGAGLYF